MSSALVSSLIGATLLTGSATAHTQEHSGAERQVGNWLVSESIDARTGKNAGYCRIQQDQLLITVRNRVPEIDVRYQAWGDDSTLVRLIRIDSVTYRVRRAYRKTPSSSEIRSDDPVPLTEISTNNRTWLPLTSLISLMQRGNTMLIRTWGGRVSHIDLAGFGDISMHCGLTA